MWRRIAAVAEAPRIAILGAGSVGCFIGGCWQAAGLPVTLIGRPKMAADIARHELTLSDYSGWRAHLTDVDYRSDASALAQADVVALTVKSGATAEAAREIGAKCRKGTLVISFQNGISNVDVLRAEVGDWLTVARGMVPFNIAYLGEGRFHKGVAGTLCADDRPGTRALAAVIGDGPAALKLSDDMLGLAWGKLIINLNNAVNALSGRTLLEELSERDYRRVVAACQREGLTLLARAGIRAGRSEGMPMRLLPFLMESPNWLFGVLLKARKVDGHARSSMSDDLAQGRKTEVEYINGELVKLAERLGADAPVNRAIVSLIHWAEAGAKPWAPAALRKEVLGR